MNQKTSEFKIVLFQAVYKGLQDIGASIPYAILPYLEKDGAIGPGHIVSDPKALDEGLKKIFGFGAKVIEKKILEALYVKLQISEEVGDNFSFPKKIHNVQRKLQSTEMHVPPVETVNIQY